MGPLLLSLNCRAHLQNFEEGCPNPPGKPHVYDYKV